MLWQLPRRGRGLFVFTDGAAAGSLASACYPLRVPAGGPTFMLRRTHAERYGLTVSRSRAFSLATGRGVP